MSDAPPCQYHPEQPSLARCSRCEAEICHVCHGSDLRGFAVCKSCRAEATRAATPWEDPKSGSVSGALTQTLWDALRSPTRFWEPFRRSDRWLPAVVFALVFVALGTTMRTLWEFVFNDEIEQLLRSSPGTSDLPGPTLRALSFARVPLVTPLLIGIHTALLQAGLKLAGAEPDWPTTARIFGYACASYVFTLLPPLWGIPIGHMLMIIWLFNLEVRGIQRFYPELGQVRPMVIVLGVSLTAIALRCF